MAPFALLLLAVCALTAPLHAASIPEASTDLQKKIPAPVLDEIKEPLENDIINEHAPVEEIRNELRAKPAEDIPVEVVVENIAPSIRINEVSDDVEIKRPQVDLRNPGPPQRQEHETQNPEQHSDEQLKVTTFKENIEQTQILLRQSFQDVTNDIQNWFSNNIGEVKIQQNIQNLRQTFTNQIQKLNDSIQAFTKPEDSKPAELQGALSQSDFLKIESRLKLLEDNFYNGVETISAGVRIAANLKSADAVEETARQDVALPSTGEEVPVVPVTAAVSASPTSTNEPSQTSSSSTPTPPTSLPQTIMNAMNQAVTAVRNQTEMLMVNIQNIVRPPPAGVQADEPSVNPGAGLISSFFNFGWQNFTNIFNRPNNGTGIFNGQNPFTGQNGFAGQNPFANFFSTTVKPAVAATTSQAVTDKPVEAQAQSDNPVAATSTNVQPASQNTGPIREFLNPVIQGFTNTVQNIQNAIIPRPPERVRDVENSDSQSSKGGWYGRPGNPSGSGDNNDSGLSEQAEEIKEPVQEEPQQGDDNKEVKPETSEKTD